MHERLEIWFYNGKFIKTIGDFSQSKNFLKRLFYEFSVTEHRNRYINTFINNNEKNLILDLGCGGGSEAIKKKGEIIGLDISLPSLKNARKLYKNVVLADLKNLPCKSFGKIGGNNSMPSKY